MDLYLDSLRIKKEDLILDPYPIQIIYQIWTRNPNPKFSYFDQVIGYRFPLSALDIQLDGVIDEPRLINSVVRLFETFLLRYSPCLHKIISHD